MHIRDDHAGNVARNDANMRSPEVASIILLTTLFAFAINESNETFIDPTGLWSLVKQAASSGNHYISSWIQGLICRPNEQIDMTEMPTTDLVMEMDKGLN